MPMRRPRKRASASSSRRRESVPSTTTRPESGRSSPAMVISSVDLPEPGRPDEADRLAAADVERNALEDMHPRRRRARGSDRHSAARWPCPSSSRTRSVRVLRGKSAAGRPVPAGPLATHMGILRMKRQPGLLMSIIFAGASLAVLATLPGCCTGRALHARGPRRQPHRRLRPAARAPPFRPCSSRRLRARATRSRSSMPASPATPHRAGSNGSTGRCRTAPTASSSNSARTTCCAASIRPSPRRRSRPSSRG